MNLATFNLCRRYFIIYSLWNWQRTLTARAYTRMYTHVRMLTDWSLPLGTRTRITLYHHSLVCSVFCTIVTTMSPFLYLCLLSHPSFLHVPFLLSSALSWTSTTKVGVAFSVAISIIFLPCEFGKYVGENGQY